MGHRDNQWHNITGSFTNFLFAVNRLSLVIVLLNITLLNVPANAEVIPRVTVSQYYNDNVALEPEGSEDHANITEIIPGVSFLHDGKRIDAMLDYRLQALYFAGKKDKDEIHHNAVGQTQVEIVPHSFFFDASANYSQQFISPEGQLDLDNLSITTNRTDVFSYQVSPYLRQRYGGLLGAEYKFTYNELKYDDPVSVTERDSVVQTAAINLASGPAFDELVWRFLVSSSKLSADDVDDSTLRNATLFARYRISPKNEFLLDVGYEDNDFKQLAGLESPTGSIWSAGWGWSPTRRTQLEIKTGERFFGKTSGFLFRHRTKRSTWEVTYSEDVTTTQQLQQQFRDVSFEIENEQGEVDTITAPVPFLERVSSVIVVERFSLSTNYQTSKSTLALGLYSDMRDYQSDDRNEDSIGGNISWQWKLLPRTTMRLAGNWNRLKLSTGDRVDHYGLGELILTRQISRHAIGSLGYKITDRNSTDIASEYTRNLAYVSVGMEF